MKFDDLVRNAVEGSFFSHRFKNVNMVFNCTKNTVDNLYKEKFNENFIGLIYIFFFLECTVILVDSYRIGSCIAKSVIWRKRIPIVIAV